MTRFAGVARWDGYDDRFFVFASISTRERCSARARTVYGTIRDAIKERAELLSEIREEIDTSALDAFRARPTGVIRRRKKRRKE